MKKYKLLSTLICLFLVLPLISSSGLTVTSNSSFVVNKTYGYDSLIEFDITNEESFTFYNISFETNTEVNMPQILQLNPGETITTNATISSTDDFVGDIKIRGFYQANIGSSNETYDINVDYDDGLDICDFTIIKGDTLKWNNLVPDTIILRNSETSNDVTSLNENENYSTTFENPEVFSYFFLRRGFIFTDTCTITVLDDQGLVNNPDYDTLVNLNVDFQYQNTALQLTTFDTNYTIEFFRSQDGILSLRNIGTSIAKDVHLSGEWFLFSENDFDIQPGYTKTLSYTIKPNINATQYTNQTYNKTLFVEGNFDKLNDTFEIIIPFAEITDTGSTNQSSLEATLGTYLEVLKGFCNADENKNKEVCILFNENRIIYEYVNETYFDYPMTLEQVDEIWKFLFEQDDDLTEFINYVKSSFVDFNQTLMQQEQKIFDISNSAEETKETIQDTNSLTLFYGLILLFCIVIIFMVILIIKKQREKTFEKIDKWH